MRRSSFLLFGVLFWACNTDTFTGDDGGADSGSDQIVVGGDGGNPTDAPSKDVITVTKRFCQEQDAQFCADFDIPNDAGAGFAPPNVSNGWALHFQQTQAESPPTALRIDTLGDASGSAYVENPLLATANGPTTMMVAEADVYLPTPGFTPDPIFVLRAGVVPTKGFAFGLAAHTGQWKLMRYPTGITIPLSPQPPTDQWVHAIIHVDIANGQVALDIGSSHAQSSATTAIDGGTNYPGYVAVGGDDAYIPVNGMTFYVDNVVVRWQ